MSTHAAVAVRYRGTDECRVCGRPTITEAGLTRHVGEAVTVVAPEPADARAFGQLIDLTEAVLARFPVGTDRADLARAIAQEAYAAGHVRRRPHKPRPDRASLGGGSFYDVEPPMQRVG